MRRRFRYDPDLECLIEIGGNSNFFEEKTVTTSVISDDVGAGVNGLRHMATGKMLDSKSRHRAENKARGLVEVGNETNFASKPEKGPDYGRIVHEAYQQYEGNFNGIADRVNAESRRKNNG